MEAIVQGRENRTKGVLRSSHLASSAAASLLFALPFRGEGGIAPGNQNDSHFYGLGTPGAFFFFFFFPLTSTV